MRKIEWPFGQYWTSRGTSVVVSRAWRRRDGKRWHWQVRKLGGPSGYCFDREEAVQAALDAAAVQIDSDISNHRGRF